MEEFVIWYNTKRPHMSLNWDQLETTVQAFYTLIISGYYNRLDVT